MRRLAIACLLAALLCLAGCAGTDSANSASSVQDAGSTSTSAVESASSSQADAIQSSSADTQDEVASVLNIQVGETTLQATLEDNSSAAALADLLRDGPLTLSLHDYGGFEKVGPLPASLPTNDTQITTEPGDVILYQGNQITIYYDVNSWSFTRLAKIDGATTESLLDVLGDGDAEVTLSLAD